MLLDSVEGWVAFLAEESFNFAVVEIEVICRRVISPLISPVRGVTQYFNRIFV